MDGLFSEERKKKKKKENENENEEAKEEGLNSYLRNLVVLFSLLLLLSLSLSLSLSTESFRLSFNLSSCIKGDFVFPPLLSILVWLEVVQPTHLPLFPE